MFGKKRTLDEILKDIANLSDEDKAKIKDKIEDLYKAEDEREVDKIEEDKAENTETEAEKKEEVKEESEEIGKDVDEAEDEAEADEENSDTEDEGEEEAEEATEAPEEEIPEYEEAPEEEEEVPAEEGEEIPSWAKEIIARLDNMEARLTDTTVEDKAKETYGLGNGVFQGDEKAAETKKTSPAEIRNILSKIKR